MSTMTTLQALPSLNAALNTISALLLIRGYFLIRAGKREAHRLTMITAFSVSTIFLISYLFYHWQVGSVHYQREGTIRIVYLTILATHTVLAALVAPLACVTLLRGLKGRFQEHSYIARFTLPIWLYVNVTGVVVYLMLYRF